LNEEEFQVELEKLIVNFEGNYKKNNTFNLKSKVQIAKLGASLLSSIEEGRLEFEDLYMVITSERLFLFDIADRRRDTTIKLLFCARLSRKGGQDLNSKLYVSKKNYENDLGFFLLFCEQEYTGHSLSWIGEREYVRYIIYKFPKTSKFSMNHKVLSHLFSVKNSSINDKFDLCERQNMMFRYAGQIYSVNLDQFDGKPD